MRYYSYPNRTLCATLDEMRKCYETRNFAGMLGLIEEAQSLANRMEAALEDWSDVRRGLDKKSEITKEIKGLENKKKELGGTNEVEFG